MNDVRFKEAILAVDTIRLVHPELADWIQAEVIPNWGPEGMSNLIFASIVMPGDLGSLLRDYIGATLFSLAFEDGMLATNEAIKAALESLGIYDKLLHH